jgi:hypothetical protein
VDGLYQVIAVGGAVLVVATGLWTAVRLHGERPFSMMSAMLAGATPALSLVIYAAMLEVDLKTEYVWGLLAGGAGAGAVLGTAIPIYSRGPDVLTRAAGWHLLLPWLAIAAIQVMGVRESFEGLVLSLAALYAATAFAVAAMAVLLVRRRGISPAAAPAPAALPAAVPATTGGRCSECASPVRPTWRFCMACGAQV